MYEVNSIKMESSTYSPLRTLEYALQCTLTAFSVEDGYLNVQLRLGLDAAAASHAGSDFLQTSCLKCSSVTGMITENKIHKNCGQCGKTVDERIGEVSLVLQLTDQDDKCQCCTLDSAEQELKSSTVCNPSDPKKMISNIEVDKSSTKTDKPNSRRLEKQSEFCVHNLESQSGNKDWKIRLSERFQLHKSDKASGSCDGGQQLTFKSVTLVNAHMNGQHGNPELQWAGDQLFEHGRNLPQHMKSYVAECTDKPNLADHAQSPYADSEPVPCNRTVTRSTNTSRNKMRSVLRQRVLTSSRYDQGFERMELRGTHTSHRQEQHQCPVCEVSHITRAHLRKHMEDHSDSDRQAYNMSNRRNRGLDASLNGENMILLREKIPTPVNDKVPTPLSGENPPKINTGLDAPLSGENPPKINTGLDTPLSGENPPKINTGLDTPLSGENPPKMNTGLATPLSGENPPKINTGLDTPLSGENHPKINTGLDTPLSGENHPKINTGLDHVDTPLSGGNPAKINTGLETPLSGQIPLKRNTGLATPLSGENHPEINKGLDPPLSGQNPAKRNTGLDTPISGENPPKINTGLDMPLSGQIPHKRNTGLDTPLSGQNYDKRNTGLDTPLSGLNYDKRETGLDTPLNGQNPPKRNRVNDERLQSLPSSRHEHTANAALEEMCTVSVKQEVMPCSENVGTETVGVKLEHESGGFQTTRKSEVVHGHKSDGSDYKAVQGISCCYECDRYYKTINCLKMHQETHKKTRVFKDLVCGEGETRAVCLKNHEVPSKDLMYKCNICRMILPSPSPSTLEKHKELQACANSLHNGHERFHDGELVQDNQQMCGTECGKDESAVVCVTTETLNVGHDFGQDHIKQNSSKNEKKAKRRRKFKTRLKSKEMKCEVCDAKYSCLRHLQIHQKKVHGVHIAQKSYQCHICGETFSSQVHFDRHADTNCTYSEKEKQKCSVCGKVLANLLSLEKHMHVHTEAKSHMCDVCGKCFLTKRSLDSHRDSHQDYRPHMCDICGRKYRNVWHMKNHRKVHTGENLLQCKECKDWFINASYLKNQHPRYCKAMKQHICGTCNRVFKDGITLQSHAGLHTGERLFDCVKCGKAFSKQRNLTDHLKRHFEELDYKCSICGKGFKRGSELRKHEKRHAGGKGTLQRYTLGPEMKPKEPLQEAIITDHELDQATVIKSHPVILMLLKKR